MYPNPNQTARALVANPTPTTSPTLLTLAWCQVKTERGQAVRQSVLHRLARSTTARPATPGRADARLAVI